MKNKKEKDDVVIVKEYMYNLAHPLKTEIESVRSIIKNVNEEIKERIKWAAPSYYYKDEDMVTFNARATKHVHLVFHHADIATIKSEILKGEYKDRRMVYLQNMDEVKLHKKELEHIITELVAIINQKLSKQIN